MIEASFAAQYGIRLSAGDCGITLREFLRLLKGVMPDTPLGRVVSVRAERDAARIRRFSTREREIRAEWARFAAKREEGRDGVDWDGEIDRLQEMLRAMF